MRIAEQVDKTLLRLSAGLADDVRDAVRASVNVDTVTREFLQRFPAGSTVTRQQARDWARLNIHPDNHAMSLVLDQLHSIGYVLGIDFSSAAYKQVADGIGKAIDANPQTFSVGFDWSTWKPGNRAAEALVRPPGGLARLLDRNTRAVTIKDMDTTTLDRLGTRLADGLAVGATDTAIAQSLRDVVGDPQRALMIAQTEMNRATSAATIDNYGELGVEQVEWFALDGCEDCEANAEAGPVNMGDEFPSGDTEPPLHPNCRCCLLPWIEGDSVAVRDGGEEDVPVDEGVDAIAPAELDMPDGVDVVDTTGDMPEPEIPSIADNVWGNITAIDSSPLNLPQPAEGTGSAVGRYVGTNNGFRINEQLRAGKLNEDAEALQQAIENSPALEKDLLFMRDVGVEGFDGIPVDEWLGKTFSDKGFLSAAAKLDANGKPFYWQYGSSHPVRIEILAPAGTKGIRGSKFENEFIFSRGSSLTVTDVTRGTDVWGNKRILLKAVITQ